MILLPALMNQSQTNNISAYVLLLAVTSFLLTSCTSHADPISTWVDEDGVRHFSSTENTDKAEAAELPDIKKYDSDSRIEALKDVAKRTCLNRGGVDCEAGPTEQGTVICADGFKGSSEKYDGSCTEIRLISTLDVPEQRIPDKRFLRVPVKVSVRNESRIEATNIRVKVSLPETLTSDDRYELLLEGPDTIPPFEIANYTYSGRMLDVRIVRRGNVRITCEECWNPLKEDNKKETESE
jgi:hypothetical protein